MPRAPTESETRSTLVQAVWRPASVLIASALVASAGASCSSATGSVSGGGIRFDTEVEPFDAGPFNEVDDPSAPPTSWRGIYRDLFGRKAVSGCAGSGTCHDAPGRQGSSSSQFVCHDVDNCWASMRGLAADPASRSTLVPDAVLADPDAAELFTVLRRREGGENKGTMPQRPQDFVFTDEQLGRIKTWIRAGGNRD